VFLFITFLNISVSNLRYSQGYVVNLADTQASCL